MKRWVVIAILLGWSCPSFAEIPKLMSYSGKLANKNGNVVKDGFYDMRFSLWTAASSGAEIWDEEHYAAQGRAVEVQGGGFNLVLGQVKALPAFDQPYYVEVRANIKGTPETFGRQQIISVPYAFRAEIANQVKDNSISKEKIIDGQIGLAEMDMNAVMPVGSIIAWHKKLYGSLPPNWVECNGGKVVDGSSPINGKDIPDLNGEKRFLRGAGSQGSGYMEAEGLKSHTHNFAVKTANDFPHCAAVSSGGDYWQGSHEEARVTNAAGGTETRPINMYVVWIMKIK